MARICSTGTLWSSSTWPETRGSATAICAIYSTKFCRWPSSSGTKSSGCSTTTTIRGLLVFFFGKNRRFVRFQVCESGGIGRQKLVRNRARRRNFDLRVGGIFCVFTGGDFRAVFRDTSWRSDGGLLRLFRLFKAEQTHGRFQQLLRQVHQTGGRRRNGDAQQLRKIFSNRRSLFFFLYSVFTQVTILPWVLLCIRITFRQLPIIVLYTYIILW